MADLRIKDLPRTVTNPNNAEYIETDHATDGSGKLDLAAFVAARTNPRPSRGALVFPGIAGNGAVATLGPAGNIGSDANSFSMIVEVPTALSGTTRTVVVLDSSIATSPNNGCCSVVWASATDSLAISRYDTFSNFRDCQIVGLIGAYGGKTVHLVVSWLGTSSQPAVWIDGRVQSLTADNPVGTAPAWNSPRTANFLKFGYRATAEVSNLRKYCVTWYNFALDTATVIELRDGGGPVPERFKTGSQVSISSGTLTVGKVYRITAAGGTFTSVGSVDNNVGTVFTATGTTPTWGTGTVVQAGAICHYDADCDGAGLQWHDQLGNKFHAVLTTPMVWSRPLQNGYVRATSDGTTTAQQLGGGTIIPANCQLLRIRARAQSGTPSITLGSSSGGSQYVASVALSTTWKDLTIALTGGIVSSATALWMTASTANAVEIHLTYDLLS